MRILGIDPSTYTGLCLLDGDQATTKLLNFSSYKGFKRIDLLYKSLANFVDDSNPDLAVIEGYAYGNKFSLVLMAEIGAMYRKVLFDRKVSWYTVPPTTLKKFATGKGTASKDDMKSSVIAKWGFSSEFDDIIDAYALARIGQSFQHPNPDRGIFKGVEFHGH